jgi:hypothetical protein
MIMLSSIQNYFNQNNQLSATPLNTQITPAKVHQKATTKAQKQQHSKWSPAKIGLIAGGTFSSLAALGYLYQNLGTKGISIPESSSIGTAGKAFAAFFVIAGLAYGLQRKAQSTQETDSYNRFLKASAVIHLHNLEAVNEKSNLDENNYDTIDKAINFLADSHKGISEEQKNSQLNSLKNLLTSKCKNSEIHGQALEKLFDLCMEIDPASADKIAQYCLEIGEDTNELLQPFIARIIDKTNKNIIKRVAEIQDQEIKNLVDRLTLNLDPSEILTSINSYLLLLLETRTPLNDDKKTLIRVLTNYLTNRIKNDQTHESFLGTYHLIYMLDKDAALEIAKICYDKPLNLIDLVRYLEFTHAKKVNECILRKAFSLDSDIKIDLMHYCVNRSKLCENTVEEYNKWKSSEEFLNDPVLIPIFVNACAVLDHKVYGEFQKNIALTFMKHQDWQYPRLEEFSQIQDIFLNHNPNMFYYFHEKAQNMNPDLHHALLHHAAEYLAKRSKLLEELKSSATSQSHQAIIATIEKYITHYKDAKNKLKELMVQLEKNSLIASAQELFNHIIYTAEIYYDFLDGEPIEFFEKLSASIIKILPSLKAADTTMLMEAYNILSTYKNDEAVKLAKACFKVMDDPSPTDMNLYGTCSIILRKAIIGDGGTSLAIECVKEFQESRRILEATDFEWIVEPLLDSADSKTLLNFLDECLKVNHIEFNKHYITKLFNYFPEDNRVFLSQVFDILLKTKNHELTDCYLEGCEINNLNGLFESATEMLKKASTKSDDTASDSKVLVEIPDVIIEETESPELLSRFCNLKCLTSKE